VLAVALIIVPVVLEHEVAGVKDIAPLQLSLEGGGGGCVRHKSNLGVCPLPDGSLPTLEILI
jgi:hypothetical protein